MAKWVKLRPAEIAEIMRFLARCSPRGPVDADALEALYRRLAAALKESGNE